MGIRWLHISDIHECDREGHFRKGMYAEVVKEVERQAPPDVVFLTGDMSFSGAEKEYRSLEESFVVPLRNALPLGCPIFTVPGNHDVARERGGKPRLWIGDADEAKAFQSIDARGAAKRKDVLLPRFSAYAAFDRRVSAWGSDWLESEAGAVWWCKEINGVRIAVAGVNTAWLCQDNNDWGKLTPGRYMLEKAIDEALKSRPEVTFVLGHHPLESLGVEGEPSDGLRIKERLKQANVLYLHGHLHASGSDRIGDALRNALTIQAPSAFQAHDDARWRNGLMWGEADVATGHVIIEPRLWDEDKREYKWDVHSGYEADRARDRDGFILRVPSRAMPAAADHAGEAARPNADLVPQGWEIVDRDVLANYRASPPPMAAMIQFFDGFLPHWRLVLASTSTGRVQPRAVVERLANRFRAAYEGARKPLVVLLAGAGGEGKSTAVLHAAAVLVEETHQNWTCLRRQATNAKLSEDLLLKLPTIPEHAWVVVIDDADNISASILAAVKRVAARTDVHLLLAARDVDWQLKRVVPRLWQPVADFHTEPLAGLDRDDAMRIVSGWFAWGDEAMGRLKGRSEEDAATALLGHARDHATRQEDGELLGALLVTRQGEDMRAHVRTLVNGLGRGLVFKSHSLRDIYAMVAAMHAENQLYLSRSVLAFAVGRNIDELEQRALLPLRREAMLDSGDTYLLTRHRRIAEAACAVMREDGDNIDRWFPALAGAALRDFKMNYTRDPAIQEWCTSLSDHFVAKGDRWWSLARAIAKALHEADPNDAHRVTTYSSVLRRTGQAKEAMAVLKLNGKRLQNDRAGLYEWATTAGAAGDHGLGVWLCGRSLADGTILSSLQCKLSLAGLGIAFRELFAASQEKAFAAAQAACGQIGLRMPELNSSDRKYFEVHVADGRRNGVAEFSLVQAIDIIRKAVILGADEVEPDNEPMLFERLIGEPDSYGYAALRRMAGET
ncbi:metallophosphoesterase [Bradyrhizobium commune]|uniref:Metallophosphoesterase n=1 Tax=Bradyrhizobium commune TaxID=83627 RepID=A0A7S9H2K7_9BRAD|nr:metallophosphoesterase [Bradyrhizobium commune]QPF93925.1 metallophosphoesterase [Bradyrhizobium commune]